VPLTDPGRPTTLEVSVFQSGGGDRYRVRVERETRAIVGGGGPELRFKTFNGDVVIRKR
jgi:hypothetical protein